MKQVVNCLLENSSNGPIDTDEEVPVSGFLPLSVCFIILVSHVQFLV